MIHGKALNSTAYSNEYVNVLGSTGILVVFP